MSKSVKVTLVFVGIFFAGAVVGGFLSLLVARSFVQHRGGPAEFAVFHKGRFDGDRYQLSPQQKARIDAIIDETSEELRKARRESSRLYQAMETRISAELTPQQRRVFEEMQKRMRERRSKSSPGGGEGKGGKAQGTPGGPAHPRSP